MGTRLCLVVETTTRHRDPWRDVRLSIVEPILRSLGPTSAVEYALILVGAPTFRWDRQGHGRGVGWTRSDGQTRVKPAPHLPYPPTPATTRVHTLLQRD
jgi:hypothetical protein